MIIQERYLEVSRRADSSRLQQVEFQYQTVPTYYKSARLNGSTVNFSNVLVPFQKTARLESAIWNYGFSGVYQKSARLTEARLGYAVALTFPKSARLTQLNWLSTAVGSIFQKTARLTDTTWGYQVVPIYQKSARLLAISLEGPWTTGTQTTETPQYQKSARLLDLNALYQFTISRYEKTARLVDLTWVSQIVSQTYEKSGRFLDLTSFFQLPPPVFQKSARLLENSLLFQTASRSYQKSGRILSAEALWSSSIPIYQRSARLLSLATDLTVVYRILQYTGHFDQIRFDNDRIIISPDVIVPKDAMGDVVYYWVGWPGTDSPHKTRGRDGSYYFTISLWKTPTENLKSIEVWYPRIPIIQGNNNRQLEVNAEGVSTFDLSSQILPEIGVYMPILKDWLRAWYHSYRSGEYQKIGDLVRSGYHWNKYRECKDLYEKALGKLQVLDTFARNAPRGTTVRPFRI